VTAVNGNRVVLRQLDAPEERSNTRIVLAYPPGILIPQLGTVINRQYGGGFAIDQIAPSNDGQTSIYVTDMELQQN
jgi:arginine/lysine/ornithine decarboxylase